MKDCEPPIVKSEEKKLIELGNSVFNTQKKLKVETKKPVTMPKKMIRLAKKPNIRMYFIFKML